MGEWRDSTWGDEISLEYGKAIRGYQNTVAPYKVYGTNGPIGWTDKPLVPGPGVILGRKGAYRGVHYSPDPFFVIDTAYFVKPKNNGLHMRWLFYAIIDQNLGEIDDGSPIPSTTRSAVYVRDLRVPPFDQQKSIATLLGALDDKIDLNRQTNEILEALARGIFKDWFVDFGPTRAKAEGRERYLKSEFWDIFPDTLDDEDKPEGWRIGTIADFTLLNPLSWTKKNPPEHIEYVDLANTKLGTIESTHRYEWSKAPSRAQRILRQGNTIVGTVRPGNGSYALIGQDGLTGSTGFAVLAPRAKEYREFVYLAATSAENIERLSNLADGAAYPAVRPDVVSATEVVITDEKSMVTFSDITSPLFDCMEANKRENGTLAQTRDLLLPKLMSGEIRLREAEMLIAPIL